MRAFASTALRTPPGRGPARTTLAGAALLGTALALAAPASAAASTGDDVLDALDRGFAALRAGNHTKARWGLERAAARLDDLTVDAPLVGGPALEEAFASDADKPYRGRPHERVLAEALLAALDIERSRCDLALPALHQAAFFDVKASRADTSDAVLVHALTLRCLVATHAGDADLARARADLRSAAGDRAGDVERAVLADDAALALDGDGPTVRADGENGERALIVPSTHPAPAGVADAVADADAAVIRLGRIGVRASLGGVARTPLSRRAGLVVWSSTAQATTVHGRPFEELLRSRSAFRSQSIRDGTGMVQKSLSTVTAAPLDARHLLAGAIWAGAGAGLTAAGAATDARADVRSVDGLFERVVLVPPK